MIQGFRCILLCFISTLILGKSVAQQLDHISPSQNQHYFTQVSFINENEGWAFDEYDHSLYHTINGGKKWEEQYHFTFRIWSLKFIDENNGYISGDDSAFIFTTEDGGKHWLETNLMQQYSFSWNSAREFTILDSMHFYLVIHYFNDSLLMTNDGGATWKKKSLPNQFMYYKTLFVLDTMHLWYAGYNSIYRSVDGGENWSLLNNFTAQITLNSIYFLDTLNGMMMLKDGWPELTHTIVKTNDGGLSWYNTDTLAEHDAIKNANIHFVDRQNGCISLNFDLSNYQGINYGIYVTHDAGNQWSSIKLADTTGSDFFISTAGYKKYVRVGMLGLVDYSTDSGDTWQSDLKHNPLFNPAVVKFHNDKIGNAVNITGYHKLEFYKTDDGGFNWQKTGMDSVSYSTAVNTYIIGPENYLTLFYSMNQYYFRLYRNGGTTSELIPLNGLKVHGFHMNDAKHIWLTTETGVFFSSDTCRTWQLHSNISGVINGMALMYFLKDNKHGWIIASSFPNQIIITNDSGYTWNTFQIGNKKNVNAVYFSDSLHGWLLESDLYKTDDGGITWQKQNLDFGGPEVICTRMLFTDAKHGWLIGGLTNEQINEDHQRQFVAYTNDSGQTWQTLFNRRIGHAYTDFNAPYLKGISAIDSNHVWIYGYQYEMYKLHYQPEFSLPDECPLSVFPNPSRVSFEIDLTCFGTETKELFIYDAVGKLVRQYQLQNETSFYEADAHLRDGIYLIHVKSASKSGTVKFIMSSIKKL